MGRTDTGGRRAQRTSGATTEENRQHHTRMHDRKGAQAGWGVQPTTEGRKKQTPSAVHAKCFSNPLAQSKEQQRERKLHENHRPTAPPSLTRGCSAGTSQKFSTGAHKRTQNREPMRSAKAETTDKGAEQATPDAQQHTRHARSPQSRPPPPRAATLPSTSATIGTTRTAGSLQTQLAT